MLKRNIISLSNMVIKEKYAVLDSTKHLLKCFDSYQAANSFRALNNRLDWIIVSYYPANSKSTAKQKSAVYFCEHMLNIPFKGNINSNLECSSFLSEYLNIAKQMYYELKGEYEADRGY